MTPKAIDIYGSDTPNFPEVVVMKVKQVVIQKYTFFVKKRRGTACLRPLTPSGDSAPCTPARGTAPTLS